MNNLTLKRLPGYTEFPGPVVTVIMDGMGIGPRNDSNGIYAAYTPTLDGLSKEPLSTRLKAHGTAVGMPSDDDMGNSEVGHNALGAGRIFSQGAKLVGEAIASKKIFESKAWKQVLTRTRQGGTLHLIGMVSDGNVHSHIAHLYALLDRAAEDGIKRVRVHGLLDGRDVGERSALSFFEPLEKTLKELSAVGRDYRIASGGGRMVTTMDRYNADWNVVKNGWNAHVLGKGRPFSSATEAIKTYYAEDPDMTDQYMASFVIVENGDPVGAMEDGDAVILFNFRGDRAIEISRAFDEPDFNEFDRERVPEVFFAGMMEYDGDAHIPKNYLVEPPAIDKTLGQYLCAAGVTSFAISETQKFGHVTYFWNGNNSGYIDDKLEKYVEIPSDRITFELRPWMKAAEITDAVVDAVKKRHIQIHPSQLRQWRHGGAHGVSRRHSHCRGNGGSLPRSPHEGDPACPRRGRHHGGSRQRRLHVDRKKRETFAHGGPHKKPRSLHCSRLLRSKSILPESSRNPRAEQRGGYHLQPFRI